MENNNNCRLSVVIEDEQTLLETVYNRDKKETNLVVADSDNQINLVGDYTDGRGGKYLPYPSDDALLQKGFIKLPSGLVENLEIKKLYEDVCLFISRYVKISDEFLTVSAVYVLLSWVYDRFHTLPYLRAIGDFGTGKSRFVDVVGNICYKPMFASSITTAGIFRTLDLIKGTLVLDEANFKSSEMWSEIIKILNSGHSKGAPVIRMNVNKKDGSFSPEIFEVFGPKILGSRERFGDDALESRCLSYRFLPMKSGKSVHLPKDFEEVSIELRNKLLAFRMNNFFQIQTNEATLHDLEFPRLRQSALALTSMASYIDGPVLEQVLSYLREYEQEIMDNQKSDIKVDILSCILNLIGDEMMGDDKKEIKVYMQAIKMRYGDSNNDYDWSDHKKYEKKEGDIWVYPVNVISARKIGSAVKNLGIKTFRDSEGFYIPVSREIKTIELLARRYGLELPWENNNQKKLPTDEPVTEEELKEIGDVTF